MNASTRSSMDMCRYKLNAVTNKRIIKIDMRRYKLNAVTNERNNKEAVWLCEGTS